MRAMILPALCRLDENPNPLHLADATRSRAGPRRDPGARVGVRRVPHRAGRDRGPHAAAAAAGRARTPGRRPGGCAGPGRQTRFSVGDRVGVAWIYSACGAVRVLPSGRGEPVRGFPGDRSRCQRRLCRSTWSCLNTSPIRIPEPSSTPRPRRCCAPGPSATARCG